jgi:hypothetical protein
MQLISSFDKLLVNLTIDQVIDHIIFVEKVQKSLSDSLNGNINSKEAAKQQLGKWLK